MPKLSRVLIASLIAFTTFFVAQVDRAAAIPISVSLSSPDDLLNLQVGQTVTFEVSVAGIDPGDDINFLSADVLLPGLFSAPSALTPGASVPDAGGFDDSGSVGQVASGLYDDSIVPSAAIMTNGVFYSFTSTALGVGTGTVGFDPGAPPMIFGTDASTAFILDVTAGPAAAFSISPAAVPEPSSWALMACGVAAAGIMQRRRKKKRAA